MLAIIIPSLLIGILIGAVVTAAVTLSALSVETRARAEVERQSSRERLDISPAIKRRPYVPQASAGVRVVRGTGKEQS